MFRRKLVINLLIIVLCGTVVLSIPVLAQHMQKSANAASDHDKLTLVGKFVDGSCLNTVDYCAVWQICQKRGNTVVATWDDIFASIGPYNPITYDREHLQLTPYGFCYREIYTAADYQKLCDSNYYSYVTYQGQTCLLKLP